MDTFPLFTEETRVYCTECGTGNPPDSKYCKECGHKINAGYRNMMLSVQDTQAIEDEAQQERLTKLLDMAFWHNEAGNLDAAILACDAALAIHPDNTTAHSLLGSLYEKKGDDERAIKHFERVLAINPESVADAVKLDQLRRGVHVKAAAPPVHYKWIPPALASVSVARLKEKVIAIWDEDQKRGPDKIAPVLGAGLAALVVFGGGLLLLWPRVQSHPTSTRVRPGTPVSVASAAYGGGTGPAASTASALPAPIVLPVRSAPSQPLSVGAVGDGPFGETLKPGTKDVIPLVRPAALSSVRPGRAGRGGKIAALPPLSLSAVSGGIAPAPVSVPVGVAAAPLPQHTVVVRDVGQGAPAPTQAAFVPPAPAVPNGDGTDGTPSRIRITINSGGDQAAPAAPAESRPAPSSGGGESAGEMYQQTALGLQQQGDFRRAKDAYQKAVDAYQAQIAAGRDTEAARRGLQACQTGIQICQQSQP